MLAPFLSYLAHAIDRLTVKSDQNLWSYDILMCTVRPLAIQHATFKQKDAISKFPVSGVMQNQSEMRWENKGIFSLLTFSVKFLPKVPKTIDMRQSYGKVD